MAMKNFSLISKSLFAAAVLTASATVANAQDNIYLYHNGHVVYMDATANVDSVALSNDKTTISLYNADKELLYSAAKADIDSMTFKYNKPIAGLLDIEFHADGSVTDVSPMKNTVEIVSTDGKIPTYYNKRYGRYVGTFENNWGTSSLGSSPTYCKVDYQSNTTFINALCDGHSLETIFKAKYEGTISDAEAKWFSSHEAGGTGLMICKKANGKNGGNEITFLPNVSTTGKSTWKFTPSGVVPESDVYYHVVGVWNKDENKAYVYVNGELKNTISTSGDLHLATKDLARWFAIGCDAASTGGQYGGNWEIVTARVYDEPLTEYDVKAMWNEIENETTAPVADVLDVVFNTDGSATDVSQMGNTIVSASNGTQTTYFSNQYQRYVAKFENTWAGTPSGYYRVDYQNNTNFKEALADGHTLEAVVMGTYTPPISDSEAKFFAAHQAGGTGLYVCKANRGKNGTNELTFLPNVSKDGTTSSWKFASSGIVPEPNVYYHIIGVWDKEAGKARVYINGELKNEIDAAGVFHFPTSTSSQWFGIGCDAGPSAQLGWTGDVVLARIYDKALDKREVELLWNEVEELQNATVNDLVTDVSYYSGLAVKIGASYGISGKGFLSGDKISFTATTNPDNTFEVPVTLIDTTGVNITIPEGMTTGKYRMLVLRDSEKQDLGVNSIVIVTESPKAAKVIAHRGYWEIDDAKNAQNSRYSLEKAIEYGYYGSETDVWMTTDGHLMINHNAALNGVTIQTSTYEQCSSLKLSNGETIPELKDFLEIIKNSDKKTKLIIEIKQHSTDAANKAAASATVKAVADMNMQDYVEYISFSKVACLQIIADDKDAQVAYLTGTDPTALHNEGFTGVDFSMASLRSNTGWVTTAHNLGMTVNAWTCNSSADINEMTIMGADFITTDKPELATAIKEYYDSQSK